MSVDFSRENLASLSKDGISEELFKLLWAKDELSFSPTINIPDTILYKYGQPATWYFTSTDGRVKRKNKHNLVSSKIEQAFNKHILGYDVIAYFITMPSELDMHRHHEIPTVIEYFDRNALNNFLYNHKKDVNGILQRFIEPKTTHNEVIRAIWSPKLCLLERAENKHALHDHRYGLYERTVVYEGPEYYYSAEPLRGPVLSGQIQKQCEAIVAHIGEVTFGQKQVSRIVLNFKVDSRDKIWFLYSTSIRSVDMLEYNPLSVDDTVRRSLVNIDSVVSLSHNVHLNPKKTYEKIVPKSLKTCLSCAKETLEDTRHAVTYKQIMKHYEHVLLILQSSSSAFHGNKKEGTIIWPPDSEVLHATGNVGFGCMQMENDEDFRPTTASSHHHTTSHSAPSTARTGHRRTMTLKHRKIRDVLIPPILGYLHTKLTPDTFERCKSDPLFQNKTVMVCEDCYLVYAEFATMMLRMGENLKKLLLPDARHLESGPSLSAPGSDMAGSNTLKRPSSADWRAISTAAMSESSTAGGGGDGGFGMSRDSKSRGLRHEHAARDRAIGLRTSDARQQPMLPSMVRSASESHQTLSAASATMDMHIPHTHSHSFQHNSSMHSSSPVPFRGGGLEQDSLLSQDWHHTHTHTQQQDGRTGVVSAPAATAGMTGDSQHHSPDPKSFTYNPQAVHTLIAERERQFFKEISLNPQLRDHHPLQHLLNAQQKLKLVDEQSGVLMNKSAQQSESIFGTRYGKQAQDHHDRYTMYATEVPYALHGEIILPSQLKVRTQQRMQLKKKKKQEALQRFLEQQRKDEEAQMEQLHRQLQEKEAIEKALANQPHHLHQQNKSMKKAASAASIDPAVISSQQYRDFLKDSLHKLSGEMSAAQASSNSAEVQQARRELAQDDQSNNFKNGGGRQQTATSSRGSTSQSFRSATSAAAAAAPSASASFSTGGGMDSDNNPALLNNHNLHNNRSTTNPDQSNNLPRTASATSVLSTTSSLSQHSPGSKTSNASSSSASKKQSQQQQRSAVKTSETGSVSTGSTKSPKKSPAAKSVKTEVPQNENTAGGKKDKEVKKSNSNGHLHPEVASLPSASYQHGFIGQSPVPTTTSVTSSTRKEVEKEEESKRVKEEDKEEKSDSVKGDNILVTNDVSSARNNETNDEKAMKEDVHEESVQDGNRGDGFVASNSALSSASDGDVPAATAEDEREEEREVEKEEEDNNSNSSAAVDVGPISDPFFEEDGASLTSNNNNNNNSGGGNSNNMGVLEVGTALDSARYSSEEGVEGGGNNIAEDVGNLDQLSIDQSSLGQSVADYPNNQTLPNTMLDRNNSSILDNGSIALENSQQNMVGEGSIASLVSMRQQTDVLMQLAASESDKNKISDAVQQQTADGNLQDSRRSDVQDDSKADSVYS